MSPIVENPSKKEPERRALGRGLAALLGNTETQPAPQTTQIAENKTSSGSANLSNQNSHIHQTLIPEQVGPYQVFEVELAKIEPNPDQPRKHFNQAKLEELALSLKEHGLVQPIVVKKTANQTYQIIAGERRWRASKLAALDKIPVIVRDSAKTTQSNDLASLIENVQREDLNAIELAHSFDRMTRIYGFTQESLAQKLGVSRVLVANTLRLLKLPEAVKEMVVMKAISEGHARALLALPNAEQMTGLSKEIVELGLTVRDVENKIRQMNDAAAQTQARGGTALSANSAGNSSHNPHASIEEELRKLFGTKVVVKGNEQRGTIEIYYAGKDSMNRLMHQLRASEQ